MSTASKNASPSEREKHECGGGFIHTCAKRMVYDYLGKMKAVSREDCVPMVELVGAIVWNFDDQPVTWTQIHDACHCLAEEGRIMFDCDEGEAWLNPSHVCKDCGGEANKTSVQ